ncbi:MAG: hypothetical protein LBU18_04270 [Treponema sp.]|jgi:hypothetical protein|nr:hypothetical protein [Treponema sp.]
MSFRTEDEWKAALLTLPDNAYFDLMRSVFGNIKTPFNKQRLMEDLAAFLSRREIQEIAAAYIDEADRRVITAIALLGEPAPGELESFFSGEYSFLDIHGMLLNLEERLIVYRFQEDGVYYLALNPILAPILSPLLMDIDILLPSFPLRPEMETLSPPDDRILAGLFAFLFEEGEFFKTDGGVRKKTLDNGRSLFPSLNIERLVGGLQIIGLFSPGEGRLNPDARQLTAFRDLSPLERRKYWAGGVYIYCRNPDLITRYPHQSRIRKLARFVHRFISILDEGRLYPRSTLKRLVEILERDDAGNPRWGEVDSDAITAGSAGTDVFLDALEAAGLIKRIKDAGNTAHEDWNFRPVPVMAPLSGEAFGPVIAMDTAFSCILYPEISFADALILAAFCSVRAAGTVVRFELTRESAIRGFDFGLNAGVILAHFERLSGKTVNQNLKWTLQDWENRYSGVALYQGTILVLSEDRRYLAQAEPIASLIARSLMPGVYLLSRRGYGSEEMDEALQGLRKAGVDIVARPSEENVPSVSWLSSQQEGEAASRVSISGAAKSSPIYPSFKTESLFPNSPLIAPHWNQRGSKDPPGNPLADCKPVLWEPTRPSFAMKPETQASCSVVGKTPQSVSGDAKIYQERFRLALQKLSLSKLEVEEFASRIDRRLILDESQLAGGVLRGEKTEARNLDYSGKTMVAKQAISLKAPVEVHWIAADGKSNRFIGIPRAMEKQDSESILVFKTLPEGDEIRLPLRKISLLRRIKQSIFGE